MSRWTVNLAWPDFWAADGGPVTLVDCSDVSDDLSLDISDALSEPSVADLLPAGLALWPRGAAWGSPDGQAIEPTSVIGRFTAALLSPFADLYARAFRLVVESLSARAVETLGDWEAEFGLPDRCVTSPQNEAERRTSLRAKVEGLATITPDDIVRLAARLGYVVALEEPEVFRVGESRLGDRGELTDTGLAQQFVIHIHDLPFMQFEVGVSEVGVDRLLDFDTGVLECAIRRVAPAWTYPVFSIAPLPVPFLLATEDGALIVTETGAGLIVPL